MSTYFLEEKIEGPDGGIQKGVLKGVQKGLKWGPDGVQKKVR